MRWLKQFKDILDKNPEITDAELFRAFPELKNDQERMTWALVYWHDREIVPEFQPWWKKVLQKLWNR